MYVSRGRLYWEVIYISVQPSIRSYQSSHLEISIGRHILRSMGIIYPFNRLRTTEKPLFLSSQANASNIIIQAYISFLYRSLQTSSSNTWMAIFNLLVFAILIPAHANIFPRQTRPSPSITSANCTVSPTACYLSTPYPVVLHPGLDCTVFYLPQTK